MTDLHHHPRPENVRIGIVGSGFIGRGLAWVLQRHAQFRPACVLTRRGPAARRGLPGGLPLTGSIDELLECSDLVVECSGDPLHATDVVAAALDAQRAVITMDAEFQVTAGSWLASRGLLTEAHGDQPGALAALHEEARGMGFEPVVYGNRKGFLDPDPTPASMQRWAKRQGISLEQVTAATDGTKIQIEQAVVANGLGLAMLDGGFRGARCEDLEQGALDLLGVARQANLAISDYLICPSATDAVFVVATHEQEQAPSLNYFGLGGGPAYVLRHPYHLCHLEIPRTIERVLAGGGVLINNGTKPTLSVAGIAKRALRPGERISRAIGSFDVRGRAVRIAAEPAHVPIGLIADAVVQAPIEPGQIIERGMVELPDRLAVRLWEQSVS